METPPEWGALQSVERVDVNQADIAPLMVRALLFVTKTSFNT